MKKCTACRKRLVELERLKRVVRKVEAIKAHVAEHGLAAPFDDPIDEIRRRAWMVRECKKSKELQSWWLARSASNIDDWAGTWGWVYSEREGVRAYRPFHVDARTSAFFADIMGTEFIGLEKSREQGATVTVAMAFLWGWLFSPSPDLFLCGGLKAKRIDDNSATWGNSTFAKLRCMIDRLPDWMLPRD